MLWTTGVVAACSSPMKTRRCVPAAVREIPATRWSCPTVMPGRRLAASYSHGLCPHRLRVRTFSGGGRDVAFPPSNRPSRAFLLTRCRHKLPLKPDGVPSVPDSPHHWGAAATIGGASVLEQQPLLWRRFSHRLSGDLLRDLDWALPMPTRQD